MWLTLALDALIRLQGDFWEKGGYESIGLTYEKSLESRKRRGNWLKDPELERAFDRFLASYAAQPRTLCHDDLLPFNVLVSQERAVLIDWEVGGMLPYPVSLARLIAHGEEDSDAFFYMTEADRAFALDYYYENLIARKGISYDEYRRTMDFFFLYEYCEWIMLGNRYPDAAMARYHRYCSMAKELVKRL